VKWALEEVGNEMARGTNLKHEMGLGKKKQKKDSAGNRRGVIKNLGLWNEWRSGDVALVVAKFLQSANLLGWRGGCEQRKKDKKGPRVGDFLKRES